MFLSIIHFICVWKCPLCLNFLELPVPETFGLKLATLPAGPDNSVLHRAISVSFP